MNKTESRLVLLASLWLTMPAAWSGELSLQAVVAGAAVEAPAKIGFDEQRQSEMLKQPLQLTGTLEYLGPGKLRKTIETPFQESVLVDGPAVEITRDGRTQRLSMKSNRMMQALLGGIAALLAGDTDSLEKDFKLSLEGEECDWTLRLAPRNQRLARHLQQLEVQGDEQAVRSILIQFNERDWQRMELQHAGPAATPQ